MRLIDADALKAQFRTDRGAAILGHSVCRLLKADAMIDNMPTIDAVPVVRCKDCIVSYCHGDDDFVCGRGGVNVDPDDFCSYGERRSDD